MDFNNEFWLKEAQSVAKLGCYVYDIKNDVWSSSEILDEIFGIDSNYVRNMHNWLNIVHYNNRAEMESYLKKILELGEDFNKEYQIIRQSDKCEIFVLGKGRLYYDEEGTLEKMVGTIQDISEIKTIKANLVESERIFQQLFDISPASITVHSDNIIRLANKAAVKLFGAVSKDELIGKSIFEVINPGFNEKLHTKHRIYDNNNHWISEKIVRFDGKVVDVEARGMHFKYQGQEVVHITFIDVTEKKAAEEKLQKSEEKYKRLYMEFQQKEVVLKSLINSIPDLIFYKDKDRVYLGCNKAFEAFAGKKEEELVGLTDFDIFEKEIAESFRTTDLKMMQQGQPSRNEEYVHYPDGKKVLLDKLKTPYYDPKGNVLGLIGISRDITERKMKEEEILYLSYNDVLTELYNRRFFEEELKRVDNEEYYPLSIIIGDVNGLKVVNDALGHLEGDELLKKAAKQIKDVCAERGIVARWGGDEFVILLPNTSGEKAEKMCKEIISKRADNNEKLKTSISLGYATKIKPSEDISKILQEAEDMMYKNKLTESQSYRYSIIESITRTLYEKDHETEEHAKRLKVFCKRIGETIGLLELELNELNIFSLLHDIGKIGVSESILKKQEKLTEEEWCKLKKHSEIGYRIVKSIPELSNIADYILSHHERWDGKGYPKGLKDKDIPLLSRILAVVDAYDAMINDRPYRKAMSKEEAIEELLINSGMQFDPNIVKIFVESILI